MVKNNVERMDDEFHEDNIAGFEVMSATISDKSNFQVCLKEMKSEDDDGLKALEDYDGKVVSYLEKYDGEYRIADVWGVAYIHFTYLVDEERSVMFTDVFRVSERDTGFIDIIPMDDQDDYTRLGTSLKSKRPVIPLSPT